MKLKSLAFAIVTSSAILFTGPAAATTVNINALNSGGTSLALSAGDHLVSWIGIANGGSYDAWSAWCCGDYWLNSILVTTSSGTTGHGTGAFPFYATPGAALAAAQSLTFHMILTNAETVNFKVAEDPRWFSDNRGGVSLNVSAVPEPETYAMLLAGLGLLGFTARRRKGTSRQTA